MAFKVLLISFILLVGEIFDFFLFFCTLDLFFVFFGFDFV